MVYAGLSLSGFLFGLKHCLKNNPYGLTPIYNLIGAFVWVDAVIFGAFWFITSLVTLYLQSWILFLLALSIFWLVRALGETIYWFNQQFSHRNRNPYHTLWFSKIFPGDSSWVAIQIFWQCIAVATSISTIYHIKLVVFLDELRDTIRIWKILEGLGDLPQYCYSLDKNFFYRGIRYIFTCTQFELPRYGTKKKISSLKTKANKEDLNSRLEETIAKTLAKLKQDTIVVSTSI